MGEESSFSTILNVLLISHSASLLKPSEHSVQCRRWVRNGAWGVTSATRKLKLCCVQVRQLSCPTYLSPECSPIWPGLPLFYDAGIHGRFKDFFALQSNNMFTGTFQLTTNVRQCHPIITVSVLTSYEHIQT